MNVADLASMIRQAEERVRLLESRVKELENQLNSPEPAESVKKNIFEETVKDIVNFVKPKKKYKVKKK